MKTLHKFLRENDEFVAQNHTQLGTNPGGVYTHTPTGTKHYVKFYRNGDQAKVEHLASRISEHMGIKTLNPQYHKIDGKHAISSKWNDKLGEMEEHDFHHLNEPQKHQLAKMYHAAVLTKNWDVVGNAPSLNIMRDKNNGDLHSIDPGGSFHFRAQGGPKDYGSDVSEHESLKNVGTAARVFRHLEPHHEQEAINSVKNMDMDHVAGLFASSGLDNHKELHAAFKARRNNLLAKYGE